MSDRFIPPCVLGNIHSRLPQKSIARFRCVSKSWQTLLSDPSFAAINFERAMANSSNSLLKLAISTHDGKLFCLDGDDIPQTMVQYAYDREFFTIFGSCNGLLCIRAESTNGIYMLNPYTHEESNIMFSHTGETGYGFGYSATLSDYQVVGISKVNDAMNICASKVMVFSLTDKLWMRDQYIPYNISNLTKKGELVNGALHWMAVKRRGGNVINILIAYNMNGQEFTEIPLPYCGYKNHKPINIKVGVLQDYLCVSFHEVSGKVEIWVMTDYGRKESWTLLFNNSQESTRQLIRNPVTPLCVMNKGKEILLVEEEFRTKGLQFYLYDRDCQCARRFEISPIAGKILHATTCMQTDVSLGHR